jgi:sarcosine oxidase subunit gamma
LEFRPGGFGRRAGAPGVSIREITDFALASVLARHGQHDAAADAAERAFGVRLPNRPKAVAGRGITFIGTGSGQWLALAEPSQEGIEARVSGALAGAVSVFEQSDSRVMLELRGEKVRDTLAKGVSVDLHPRAFKPGDAALTTVSRLAVQIWQTDEAPTYRLLVIRTFFDSFWSWLASSAAEYGAEVLEPLRYPAAP